MTDPQEAAVTDLATSPTTEPDIDLALLAEAQRQMAVPRNAVINEALRRLVMEEREKRRAARLRLNKMYQDGEFDFSRLDGVDE